MREYSIILTLLISCPVSAEWTSVANGKESTYFVENSSIRKEGNIRKTWEIENLKKPQKNVSSLRSRVEYDCKQERYRTLSFSTHTELMAKGSIVDSGPIESPSWNDIPPGTVSYHLYQYVCSR